MLISKRGIRRLTKPSAGQVPRKLFKIGEVMAATGISRQTIHDYTVSGFIEEEERTILQNRASAQAERRARRQRALEAIAVKLG